MLGNNDLLFSHDENPQSTAKAGDFFCSKFMARSSKFPCRKSGCSVLLGSPGFCDKHRSDVYKAQKKAVTIDYVERNRFYQRKAWKDARAMQMLLNPLCVKHKSLGQLIEATHVDHIVPIEFGGDEYDQSNLQSMCKSCHEAKTRHDEHCRKNGDWSKQ